MFRQRHQQQAAAGSFLNSGALPRVSSAAQQLAVRLSPTKDADAQQVHNTISLLCLTLQQHGVALSLERVGTFTYSAAGRKLHVRMLNGNLLVRTGGGYQDLLDALGKLPAPTSFTESTSATAAAAASDAGGKATGASGCGMLAPNSVSMLAAVSAPAAAAVVGGMSPSPSPRTPTMSAAAPCTKLHSDHCIAAAAAAGSSSDGMAATRSSNGGYRLAGSLQSPRVDYAACSLSSGQHSALFKGAPLGMYPATAALCSKEAIPATGDMLHGRSSSRSGSGSIHHQQAPPSAAANGSGGDAIAAMEAAVQAAVAAAVEAAANAGLDEGSGTSGGGALPPGGIGGGGSLRLLAGGRSPESRLQAALLGRALAATTAAGTLIEAGMCPPVPVHEEVSTPAASAHASASGVV